MTCKEKLAIEHPEKSKKTNMEDTHKTETVEVIHCCDCKYRGWIQEPCHGKCVDYCHIWEACIPDPDKCFCYYQKEKE